MKLSIRSSLLALSLLAACSAGGGSSTSNLTTGQYTGQNLEGGAVTQVQLDSSNKALINLGTVTNTSKYVLAIHSYHESGVSSAFQVGNSETLPPPNRLLGKALVNNSEEVTEDFHDFLRQEEANLDPDALLISDSHPKAIVKALNTNGPELGSTRSFKVLNSFSGGSSYATVTATLVYKTSHFFAYMDSRDVGSLTSGDLKALLDPYDAKIEDERELFGHESDIDNDGHFNILLTREVNKLGGSAGGIVTGFFYAVDLFNSSVYAQSSETEIFYTFVPDPSGQHGVAISKSFALSNILPSVLPHEYQHMINFNMHYFENNGSPELSFLNEALSHLAEDIYSQDSSGYMAETGIENPARVSGYLSSTEDLCITCGSSLYQRGGSYLFMRYLYEQAEKGNLPAASSGANLIERLLDSNKTGVDNIINAVYGQSNRPDLFRSLMGQFGLAVFLSDTGLTTDDRLQIDGIGLRETQNDNRGTVLQGPLVNTSHNFPLTNTVSGTSVSFTELRGSDINTMNGQMAIQFSETSKVGAYLIQTAL